VQQAESHSKIEEKINNKEIRAMASTVKLGSKQEFKKRRVDSVVRGAHKSQATFHSLVINAVAHLLLRLLDFMPE
jgi:hypothetical protein